MRNDAIMWNGKTKWWLKALFLTINANEHFIEKIGNRKVASEAAEWKVNWWAFS